MKTKRLLIIFAILPLCAFAQQSRLTLNLNNKGIAISPTHYGLFFEDINHAADGGLYAELIRNRSFEDAATPENWSTIKYGDAVISTSLFSTDLVNSAQTKSLQLTI